MMDFLKNIDKETLIICDNCYKEEIIKEGLILPIKIMNLKEFIHNYYFSYDEEAICYLMDEYHITYNIASEYLENLYYVDNKSYGISKLDLLVDIKNKLIEHDLLIYNEYFINYLKKVNILIYDLDLDEFYIDIFKNYNYEIIKRKYHDYKHEIISFKTMDDEVAYVAYEIAKLIDSGVNVQNIKLTNVDKSYYNTLNKIFNLFGLKVNIPYHRKLISYPLVKEFLRIYDDGDDIKEALLEVKDDSFIYNELVKVINKYLIYDNKELIRYKITDSYLDTAINSGISIIDYLSYVAKPDEYIFMLGFNEGLVPKYYMDTEYITDNMADLVKLKTTKDKNMELKERVLKVIGDIKNLVITYKLADYSQNYYESNLASYFEVVNRDIDIYNSYSHNYDLIKLVKMYDEYMKYGIISPVFNLYNGSYQLDYNSYSNKYSKIDNTFDKLYLSYTKMNIYNKCHFRYYLTYVLGLDMDNGNTASSIGQMVHFVMEQCLRNNDCETQKYVDTFLLNNQLNNKEKYFFNKAALLIPKFLDKVLEMRNYMALTNEEYEKNMTITIDDNTFFVGIIDKLLYLVKDDTLYAAIVDYKTGDASFSLDYIDYGINIQVPIYMYLASKMGYENVRYVGAYLQKFDFIKQDFRLMGYTNSDPEVTKLIDNDYENSKVVRGLKVNKDGSFARYSNVLSDSEFTEIIEKVDKQIKTAVKGIRDNDFKIDPKATMDDKVIGCEFCKYKDICFMSKADLVKIGDNNRL